MASVKPQYVAVIGINFKNAKGERRVEAGDPVPADLSASDLKDLLDASLIKPKESEGEKE